MLIGLYSRGRRAGKDTAASYISDWCRRQCPFLTSQRLAFADMPKLLVAEILGIKAQNPSDTIRRVDDFKLTGRVGWSIDGRMPAGNWMSGRDFIINLCGEIGVAQPSGARKLFGDNFWVDAALPTDWEPAADITVLTDVRADEEADRIRLLGGQIVEIINPRAESPGGRSERGITRHFTDYEIFNTGTLEEYRVAVEAMVEILWRQHHTIH